jgi:hypothetical protein
MTKMLRKGLAVLALIPLAFGAGQQEEFEVLLEDMIEKVSPLRQAIRLGVETPLLLIRLIAGNQS